VANNVHFDPILPSQFQFLSEEFKLASRVLQIEHFLVIVHVIEVGVQNQKSLALPAVFVVASSEEGILK